MDTIVQLIPLEHSDREQFILDNQEAFNYGAMEEFGLRDDHFEALGPGPTNTHCLNYRGGAVDTWMK